MIKPFLSVADRAKWRSGTKGDGARGRGISFVRYETTKTYVAMIADILVDRQSDAIRIERITAAADSGLIISPSSSQVPRRPEPPPPRVRPFLCEFSQD
jgi:CO/xanthine dehydrogenase Mo-binding subunit